MFHIPEYKIKLNLLFQIMLTALLPRKQCSFSQHMSPPSPLSQSLTCLKQYTPTAPLNLSWVSTPFSISSHQCPHNPPVEIIPNCLPTGPAIFPKYFSHCATSLFKNLKVPIKIQENIPVPRNKHKYLGVNGSNVSTSYREKEKDMKK